MGPLPELGISWMEAIEDGDTLTYDI